MPDTLRRDPVQEFANRIVAEREKGIKPWVRPWDLLKAGGPHAPFNPVTGKRYHGINVLILGIDIRAFQSGDPRWMTYQQAQEKHWQVRKAEKVTAIFFTKQLGGKIRDSGGDEAPDEPGKRFVFFMKTYAVFHASQIDGVPEYKAPGIEEAPWTRPEAADIILKNSGATIRVGGDRAFYSPATDHIRLPPEHAFRGPPEFAATALHELGSLDGTLVAAQSRHAAPVRVGGLRDGGIARRVGVGLRGI
jgi:antirestriction protein ArdC